MNRLTILIKNRLVLAGAPAFEAPYLAREAIAFAREIGIIEEADVVRFALITRALGPIVTSSNDINLLMAVLLQRAATPSARLDFIERTWGRAQNAEEG